MSDSGDYNGGDGPLEISISLPLIEVTMIGIFAAVLALIGFLLSWLLNKQAFFSRSHLACLLFLLPPASDLIVRNEL
jgi:hypothetical protein